MRHGLWVLWTAAIMVSTASPVFAADPADEAPRVDTSTAADPSGTADAPDERDAAAEPVAIVFVIDGSGSMDGEKLEGARAALEEAIDVLGDQHEVALIRFDDTPRVYVARTSLADRAEVLDTVARIRAGGGTDIQPALEQSHLQLVDTSAARRHVILVSDGQSGYGTIGELTRSMRDEGITISTVALGDSADTVLLDMIADNGGGRAHATDDPAALADILRSEVESLLGK